MGEFLFVDVSTKEAIESHMEKTRPPSRCPFYFPFGYQGCHFMAVSLHLNPL